MIYSSLTPKPSIENYFCRYSEGPSFGSLSISIAHWDFLFFWNAIMKKSLPQETINLIFKQALSIGVPAQQDSSIRSLDFIIRKSITLFI